jgi:hypothetical protein
MLEVKYYRRFTKKEQNLLHAVANTVGRVKIDQKPDHIPRYVRATGKTDIAVPLAWLVLNFIGTGATIMVGSFLKTIGSELGKKFVKHFAKRRKSKKQYSSWSAREPLYPVAVTHKVKPAVHCVIRIDLSTDNGISDLPETLQRIKKLATKLQRQRRKSLPNAVIQVRFDEKVGKWIVENDPRTWLEI